MTHTNMHSFHIPVMGIAYTIDTPLKVSQYGISSVISLCDDELMEKLRKFYCNKFKIKYSEISDKIEDYRANRITSYLNMIKELAEKKFEEIKNAANHKNDEIKKYIEMLPDFSVIKQKLNELTAEYFKHDETDDTIMNSLKMGSIDVNIMTKVDKENYFKGEKLPNEFNDAHAALRGYANSDLHSSLVLSAGMNPRLYSYLEQFEDFYPDEDGNFKKKVILKVSDYRSALIQGKFLAKKGIWVSEYRIESGLNCGGHAFATDGYLLGPILAEFRDKRQELIQSIHEVLINALAEKNKIQPSKKLSLSITAQGGVGTAEEHQFLIDHYKVDSVGWGTPFLLVPEATTVDEYTLNQLIKAKEEDLYLSDISPLGVPFNNLKNNTKDLEKLNYIRKGRPGSSCPKRFLALNKDFDEKGLCTASRQYQHSKIKELDSQNLPTSKYKAEYDKIVDKACICTGLGTSALLANNLDTRIEKEGVSICPGPNMAYFSKKMTLREITDHIYGRKSTAISTNRPNMFIKELTLYLDYLKNKIIEAGNCMSNKQEKYLKVFSENLNEGINYYQNLFSKMDTTFKDSKKKILEELHNANLSLQILRSKIEQLKITEVIK